MNRKITVAAIVLCSSFCACGSGIRAQVTGPRPFTPINVTKLVSPDTPLNRSLVDAVTRNDTAAVIHLLNAGASADTTVSWNSQPDTSPIALTAAYGSSVSLMPGAGHQVFDILIAHVRNVDASLSGSGDSLLMAAAELGDFDAVKRLIDEGADVNARTKVTAMGMHGMAAGNHDLHQFGSRTALFEAVHDRQGQYISPIVTYLIGHGADVNAVDVNGRTVLMEAAQAGQTKTIVTLLARGANPSLRDSDGHDALYYAGLTGRPDIVSLLIPLTKTTMTLDEAAASGQTDQVRQRLDAGDDPNALNWQGWTPLMSAMKSGNAAVVTKLIDHGARVNGAGRNGATALEMAALYGQTDLAKLLLDHDADPNAASTRKGTLGRPDFVNTPLIVAAENANAGIVDLLLNHHIDLAVGDQGTRALQSAVQQAGQTFSVIRPRHGAPLVPRRTEDEVLGDQDRVLQLLLAAGVSPADDESHVVYTAASEGQTGIVEDLLDHGGSVNGRGHSEAGLENHETALMGAIQDYWLAGGEGRDKPDTFTDQEDPNVLRTERQQAMEVIHLLLSRHANVNLTDASGTTPVAMCIQDSLPSLAESLIAHGATASVKEKGAIRRLSQAIAPAVPY